MGCCSGDKCSEKSANKSKTRIPWFVLLLVGIGLLVVLNWQ